MCHIEAQNPLNRKKKPALLYKLFPFSLFVPEMFYFPTRFIFPPVPLVLLLCRVIKTRSFCHNVPETNSQCPRCKKIIRNLILADAAKRLQS